MSFEIHANLHIMVAGARSIWCGRLAADLVGLLFKNTNLNFDHCNKTICKSLTGRLISKTMVKKNNEVAIYSVLNVQSELKI